MKLDNIKATLKAAERLEAYLQAMQTNHAREFERASRKKLDKAQHYTNYARLAIIQILKKESSR